MIAPFTARGLLGILRSDAPEPYYQGYSSFSHEKAQEYSGSKARGVRFLECPMGFDDRSSTSTTSLSAELSGDLAGQLSDRAWRDLPAETDAPATPASDVLWERVRSLIELHLTERQRQVLELYYLRGLDQAGVATLLGISQQSVSEHLFGKSRHHRHVGGLVHKLRKLCARDGIEPGRRLPAEVMVEE